MGVESWRRGGACLSTLVPICLPARAWRRHSVRACAAGLLGSAAAVLLHARTHRPHARAGRRPSASHAHDSERVQRAALRPAGRQIERASWILPHPLARLGEGGCLPVQVGGGRGRPTAAEGVRTVRARKSRRRNARRAGPIPALDARARLLASVPACCRRRSRRSTDFKLWPSRILKLGPGSTGGSGGGAVRADELLAKDNG
jgi:hypothetical protein